MLQRGLLVFSLTCVFVVLVQNSGFGFQKAKTTSQESELTDANFAAWRDRIKPRKVELRWEELDWLTSYHEGLHQAAAEKKPLILWVMNGHPFGCT